MPAEVGRVQAQTEDIMNAFDDFERNYSGAVEVQAMTGVAAYSVMHEQICDVADEKRVSLVILPFHKQQTVDGGMENANPQYRSVNKNVLGNSPCSVGILVDRGLRGTTRNTSQVNFSTTTCTRNCRIRTVSLQLSENRGKTAMHAWLYFILG